MYDPKKEKDTKVNETHFFQWGLTAFCVIIASLLVFFVIDRMPEIITGIKKVLGILSPFIYGFVMAYLLLPIYNGLYRIMGKHTKIRPKILKGLCSFATLAAGLAIVIILLWMVLPQLVVSIISLLESLDVYLEQLSKWIGALLKDTPVVERSFLQLYEEFSNQVIGVMQNIAPRLVELMTGVKNTVSVLFNFLIGIIISLYILNSKDLFCAQAKKIAYSMLSIDRANQLVSRTHYIHRVFGGFITGKLIDSFIIGVLCFIGLIILKIPYAVLISVIIGITNIIPFFGPFIGAVPSAILIFVIDPVKAIYFVVFILLLQQFDGNILGPKILGNSTGLSSFWVMFAIIVFGGVFGFVGMAIGVPIFAVLYSIMTEVFNSLLKKRGLSTDTNAYRGNKRVDPNTKKFVENEEEEPPITKKERKNFGRNKAKK